MIKPVSLLILLWLPLFCGAQNIQLHYDFGKGRNCLSSTFEMFKPDKYGNTFAFVDMDYGTGGANGVTMAYWEIARAVKLWENPIAFHLEYNGGLGQWEDPDGAKAYSINDSWLGGVEYSKDSKDFSKGFTLQALYKYIKGKHDYSFQLTGIWYLNLWNDKFSFTGFADFWREDMTFQVSDGKLATTRFVFQAEPQIWYNFSKHVSAGSEVEFSNNFAGKGFRILPTLGLKAIF